jgi:NAD(P)H-dependent flavin oxidoreductase YrpB (nitropropane dioxygenase family)
MLVTPFTELIGCRVPIQQAPIAGAAGPALVEAVCRGGGLGMVPMTGLMTLGDAVAQVEASGCGPFGVNFLAPFLPTRERDAIIERVVGVARLVEFFYGDPDPELVARVHGLGALAGWQVGSVEEAKAAAGAGCDLVVAQGVEAGGHVRGHTPLLLLLDAVCEAVAIPVVAAGGIAGPRAMAAALAAGASAVRVGTRFIASAESDAHADYIDAVVAAGEGDTVLTTAFGAEWPDAPHRVLRSALTAAAFAEPVVGASPGGGEVVRFSTSPPSRGTTGNIAAMALYAGEGVGAVRSVEPAADIVADLAAGAEALLRRWD